MRLEKRSRDRSSGERELRKKKRNVRYLRLLRCCCTFDCWEPCTLGLLSGTKRSGRVRRVKRKNEGRKLCYIRGWRVQVYVQGNQNVPSYVHHHPSIHPESRVFQGTEKQTASCKYKHPVSGARSSEHLSMYFFDFT